MTGLPKDDKKKTPDDLKSLSFVPKAGGGGSKERVDLKAGKQESTPMIEYTRKVDLEPEVEGWLEKLEKEDAQLQQPMTDDKGQVVVDSTKGGQGLPSGFKVILPMTKEEMDKGLHHKFLDSVRWLAEWCVRMIKMFHGKVAYRRK